MWSAAAPLVVSAGDRERLGQLVRARRTPQKMVLRARIVLLASEGLSNCAIAQTLETNRNTVLLFTEVIAGLAFLALPGEIRHFTGELHDVPAR